MNPLQRLAKVLWTVSRYRLDTLLNDESLGESPIPPRYRALLHLLPSRLIPIGDASRGRRLRLALEELGPVFIKFGQLMSTRRDIIPLDIADELARLQDDVPPFPGIEAQQLIESSIGKPTCRCLQPLRNGTHGLGVGRPGSRRDVAGWFTGGCEGGAARNRKRYQGGHRAAATAGQRFSRSTQSTRGACISRKSSPTTSERFWTSSIFRRRRPIRHGFEPTSRDHRCCTFRGSTGS